MRYQNVLHIGFTDIAAIELFLPRQKVSNLSYSHLYGINQYSMLQFSCCNVSQILPTIVFLTRVLAAARYRQIICWCQKADIAFSGLTRSLAGALAYKVLIEHDMADL